MPPISPTILATLRKNIEAVKQVDPALAGQLENIEWPEDLTFCSSLDGVPTARSKQFGKSGWFAFTTAPKIREKGICENFVSGGSNVIFPSAGQGYGLRMLLEQFESYQSIFVWEKSILPMAVLLSLYDFSQPIVQRRLIFLVSEDLKKTLVDFLTKMPEILVPNKIINWPWIQDHQMHEISLMVEQAVNTINDYVSKVVGGLQESFSKAAEAQSSTEKEHKNIEIFALDPHPRVHQLARNFYSAAGNLQFMRGIYVVDSPERSTSVGTLKYLNEHIPDVVFSIGVDRKHWVVKIPSKIPFITMLTPPGVVLGEEVMKNIVPGENETFIVGTSEDAEILKEKLNENQVRVVDLAVNSDVLKPMETKIEAEILVFADRIDTNPEKHGINQQSHKYLWQHVENAIEDNPLGYYNARAEDLVVRVSNQIDIKLNEKELMDSFVTLVKQVLAPAVVGLRTVEKLIQSGISVRIIGSGWQDESRFANISRPMPKTLEELNEILNSGRLVLHLDNETNWRSIVFDAICAGKPVLVKTFPSGRFPESKKIEQGLVKLNPAIDLVQQVRQALNNYSALVEKVRVAREFLVAQYSYEKILSRILAG